MTAKKPSTKKPSTANKAVDDAAQANTLEVMAARIAELERKNEALEATKAVPVPQGQDNVRKNKTVDLVQQTRSGNIRTTFDPSLEFVADQVNQGALQGDDEES